MPLRPHTFTKGTLMILWLVRLYLGLGLLGLSLVFLIVDTVGRRAVRECFMDDSESADGQPWFC